MTEAYGNVARVASISVNPVSRGRDYWLCRKNLVPCQDRIAPSGVMALHPNPGRRALAFLQIQHVEEDEAVGGIGGIGVKVKLQLRQVGSRRAGGLFVGGHVGRRRAGRRAGSTAGASSSAASRRGAACRQCPLRAGCGRRRRARPMAQHAQAQRCGRRGCSGPPAAAVPALFASDCGGALCVPRSSTTDSTTMLMTSSAAEHDAARRRTPLPRRVPSSFRTAPERRRAAARSRISSMRPG